MNENLKPLHEGILNNRSNWQTLVEKVEEKGAITEEEKTGKSLKVPSPVNQICCTAAS